MGVPMLVPAAYGGQQPSNTYQTYPNSQASPGTPTAQTPQPLASPVPAANMFVTPALVEQVMAASSSDPQLRNCINMIYAGNETEEHLRTLGRMIHSIQAKSPQQSSNTSTPPSASPAPAPAPTPSQPINTKEFDLVLEFQERSSDRWIFPRGTVFCERVAVDGQPELNTNSHMFDILVTTLMPFAGSAASSSGADTPAEDETPSHAIASQPVTFRFSKINYGVWDLLMLWVGGEQKMEENRKALSEVVYLFVIRGNLTPADVHFRSNRIKVAHICSTSFLIARCSPS